MTYLVLFLVIAGAIAVIGKPLVGPRQPWQAEDASPAGESNVLRLLQGEKNRILRKLKDLEMERDNGGLDDEEYEELHSSYVNEAAMVNRRMELMRGEKAPEPPSKTPSTVEEGAK